MIDGCEGGVHCSECVCFCGDWKSRILEMDHETLPVVREVVAGDAVDDWIARHQDYKLGDCPKGLSRDQLALLDYMTVNYAWMTSRTKEVSDV